MKPVVRLDRGGIRVLCLGLGFLTVGVLATNPIITLWGQVVLAALLLAYPLALRDAIVARTGALDISCEPPTGPGGALIAGEACTIPIEIRSQATTVFSEVQVRLVCSQGLSLPAPAVGKRLLPGQSVAWALPAQAVRVGPAFVHGAHVIVMGAARLYRSRSYRPLDVQVGVLPRTASRHSRQRLLSSAATRDALSLSARPVRGVGSDIRELRDHSSGDPFKHIAWKASARARRLIVREFESEVSLSAYVLLDIGATMRAGEPGQTRLDAAIDLTFQLGKAHTAGHDRFGLVTYDHRVFGVTRASSGNRMPHQLMAHLQELHAVVQAGFTEPFASEELISRVARFMASQQGVNLSLGELQRMTSGDVIAADEVGDWDDTEVLARAERALADRAEALRRARAYLGEPGDDPSAHILRTYCRLLGLELPYRTDAVPKATTPGLLAAVEKTLQDRGGPHTLMVVTDLAGVDDARALSPALRLAQAHRHTLVFSVPRAPAPSPTRLAAQDDLEHALQVTFEVGETARQDRLAAALRRQGARVLFLDPAS